MNTPEPTAFTHSADCMCHHCLPGSERKAPEPTAEAREAGKIVSAHILAMDAFNDGAETDPHGDLLKAIATALAEKDAELSKAEMKRDAKWQAGIDEVLGEKLNWNANPSAPEPNPCDRLVKFVQKLRTERDTLKAEVDSRDRMIQQEQEIAVQWQQRAETLKALLVVFDNATRRVLAAVEDEDGFCPECVEPCSEGMEHDDDCWVGILQQLLSNPEVAKLVKEVE